MVSDSLQIILLFGLIALVANYFGWKRGFFRLTPQEPPPIQFKHVASVFAIYLACVIFVAPYLAHLLIRFSAPKMPSFGLIMTIQFVILLLMGLALLLYCMTQAKDLFKKIWKSPLNPPSSLLHDFGLGIAVWLMAFPIVSVVGQFFDLVLYIIFQLEQYEQVAVKYLKSTLSSPSQAFLALISIIVIAPIVEEFLFRGSLQTYLKRRFGTKAAIILAAACFAAFHFSTSQGLGNISLIPSLFTFGCFLGFIYERQQSLFASIGLHMTFNFASSLRILFLPE